MREREPGCLATWVRVGKSSLRPAANLGQDEHLFYYVAKREIDAIARNILFVYAMVPVLLSGSTHQKKAPVW